MLNENLEVAAYLCEVNPNDEMRVLPSNLTGKYTCRLNGLQDILTLIAREFMFTHMNATECTTEVHDACISALQLWCAFEDDKTLKKLRKEPKIQEWLTTYPYADRWLKTYFDKIITLNEDIKLLNAAIKSKKKIAESNIDKTDSENETLWDQYKAIDKKRKVTPKVDLQKEFKECYEKILSKLRVNNPEYKEKAFDNKTKWEDYVKIWKERLVTPGEHLYAAKTFCYENILAEALADGPLKVRYLAFKSDEETFNNSLSKIGSKPSISTYRKNYKFIAANLLAAARSGNQETIYLRKIRLLNWLGHDNDNLSSWFPALRWNDTDICERFSGKDFVKLKMNNAFINHYDIKLIDESELSEYKTKGYTILEDVGHGVPLEKVN